MWSPFGFQFKSNDTSVTDGSDAVVVVGCSVDIVEVDCLFVVVAIDCPLDELAPLQPATIPLAIAAMVSRLVNIADKSILYLLLKLFGVFFLRIDSIDIGAYVCKIR
jgi:hypothetical protein